METAKSRLSVMAESGNVAQRRVRSSDGGIALVRSAAIAVAEGRGGERPPNGAADEQI